MKTIIIVVSAAAMIVAYLIFHGNENRSDESNHSPEGIRFEHLNWDEALAMAQKEKKLVFLDAYASWCGPCKMLKNKTFPDEKVGAFFNQHFVSIAVDMEKGEGPLLARHFEVSAYPTLIITDPQGNLITEARGFMPPRDLLAFGKYGVQKAGKYNP